MKLRDFFDKIFIINLDRRFDRWNQTVTELVDNGIPVFFEDRFPAIRTEPDGMPGCAQSHKAVLQQIADGPWERALVLEDDIKVITKPILKAAGFEAGSKVWDTFCTVLGGVGTLDERFGFLFHYLPRNWDLVYLGGGYGGPPLSRINRHVLRAGYIKTTSSYGVTREHAKRLASVDWIGGPDDVISNFSNHYLHCMFQPRLLFQSGSKSDITGQSISYLNSMTDPVHENLV